MRQGSTEWDRQAGGSDNKQKISGISFLGTPTHTHTHTRLHEVKEAKEAKKTSTDRDEDYRRRIWLK